MAVTERLASLAERYDLPPGAAEQLSLLLALVEASPISLTTVREQELAVDVHVADSLLGLLVPEVRAAESIADLGSGAGYPGLVLAVARPESTVTLVESVGKKATFLMQASEELGLANVVIVAARAEEWAAGTGTQAVVTARAVASLSTLVEYAAPLLRPGGALVAWKGPAGESERADGAAAAERLGMSSPGEFPLPLNVHAPGTSRNTHLYVSSKVSSTPDGYPRRPGMARKRPIRS